MTFRWGPARPVFPRRALVLVLGLALLLVLPGVQADADAPSGTTLEMALPLELHGTIDAEAGEGVYVMGPLEGPVREFLFVLEAEEATVKVTNLTERRLTDTGGDRLVYPSEESPQTRTYGPYQDVTVRIEEADAGFFLMAHGEDTGTFAMQPRSQEATLDEAEPGRKISYVSKPNGNQYSFVLPEGMLAFTGDDPDAVLAGDFNVLLFGTAFDVRHAHGSQHVKTGTSTERTTSSLLPGLPVEPPVEPLQRKHTQHAVLELKGARLGLVATDMTAEMIAPFGSLTVDVDGIVASSALIGSVVIGDDVVSLEGDAARLEGKFSIRPVDRSGDGKAVFAVEGDVETLTVGRAQFQSDKGVAQAAGIAVIVAGLGAAAWHLGKSGVFLPLYAKLTRRKVLDQATRQQVHDKVHQDPGCTTRTVADALGVSWSTAAYHLRVLRHMDLITSKRQGRHEHFFLTGESSKPQQVVHAVLQNPTTRRIARLIAENPGIIQKDVCRALGIAASTASDHLKRLREAGAVKEVRQWRTRAYHPAPLLVSPGPPAAVQEHTPGHGPRVASATPGA